jgi:hypothetical protein
MSNDPIDIALKQIVETRDLLETLILSSEQFDYHGAKEALARLQRKVKDLAKCQAELEGQREWSQGDVSVVQFREQEFDWPSN